MSTTQKLLITGVAEVAEEWGSLAISNEDYDLTQKELIEKGLVRERIYEYLYSASSIVLKDSADPDNPEEYAPIFVVADGQNVGRLRPANTPLVRSLLAEDRIEDMALEIRGGDYRIVLPEGEDSFTTETGTAAHFAALTLTIKDPPRKQSDTGTDGSGKTDKDDDSVNFIDTTYAYEEKKEDLSRRGFVFLLLAAILTTFYLGFSFFYWRDILSGTSGGDIRFGHILSNRYLIIHFALVGAAFLFNIISVFCANCYLPLLAAICYLASAAAGPQYIIFTALQALLCLLASMRKRRGSVVLRVLLIPILLCAGTLAVLARLSVITEIPFVKDIPAVSNIPMLRDISWFANGLPFQEASETADDSEEDTEEEYESEWADEWDESWWEEESDGSMVFYDIEAESEYFFEDYEWESEELYDEDGEAWIAMEDETDWYEEDLTEAESEPVEDLTEAETVYHTTANLNVRSSPGTDSTILGKLNAGDEVTVLSSKDGWAEIKYEGQSAYVSENYLTAP